MYNLFWIRSKEQFTGVVWALLWFFFPVFPYFINIYLFSLPFSTLPTAFAHKQIINYSPKCSSGLGMKPAPAAMWDGSPVLLGSLWDAAGTKNPLCKWGGIFGEPGQLQRCSWGRWDLQKSERPRGCPVASAFIQIKQNELCLLSGHGPLMFVDSFSRWDLGCKGSWGIPLNQGKRSLGKEGWDCISHKSISENPLWKGRSHLFISGTGLWWLCWGCKKWMSFGMVAQKIQPEGGKDTACVCWSRAGTGNKIKWKLPKLSARTKIIE